MCTNSIDSYHLLYHRFGKKSMYKLHKISQRFLCRIPIDSKQGAPGPPARLCAMVHVYPYPGTPYPYTHGTPYLLPTYIHALIHLFYLFIYLIVFVFVYLIVFVSLTLLFSLVLSPLALSLPLARPALGQRQQVLSFLCVPMFYFI